MSAPVALLGGLDELRERVTAGHHDFAIMLAGGAALSRKTIDRRSGLWSLTNHIDGSKQRQLVDADLWTESNIGEALDKGALLDMSGNDGIIRVANKAGEVSIVEADGFLRELRAGRDSGRVLVDGDPTMLRLNDAPGAIRIGEDNLDWEPADPELVLERCEIGAFTVANIDISAIGLLDATKITAATSIELTIEDIDALIAALSAIRQNAIDFRHFRLNADGNWTDGTEND